MFWNAEVGHPRSDISSHTKAVIRNFFVNRHHGIVDEFGTGVDDSANKILYHCLTDFQQEINKVYLGFVASWFANFVQLN